MLCIFKGILDHNKLSKILENTENNYFHVQYFRIPFIAIWDLDWHPKISSNVLSVHMCFFSVLFIWVIYFFSIRNDKKWRHGWTSISTTISDVRIEWWTVTTRYKNKLAWFYDGSIFPSRCTLRKYENQLKNRLVPVVVPQTADHMKRLHHNLEF